MKTTRLWVFLIAYACAVALFSSSASWGIAPEDAASAIYGATSGNYDSTGSFENNVSKPITSSNTPMYTLDGSKSFNAQLTCPSTSSFLEISVIPSATGDLSATVRQDTNFDGILDYVYSPPFNLSGVCSNGVVSCDSGTWLNCKYYLWTAGGNFQTTLQPASITELGGCYCVNQSCGASYSDYSTVLKDIGGGAAGAIQKVDARFAITDAKIVGDTISYHGQDSAGCATTSSASSNGLQAFYTNQDNSGLTTASDSEILNQMKDTSSAYYNVKQSFDNSSSGVFAANCNIKRVITIKTETYSVTGSSPSPGSLCVDHYLYARIFENGFDYHLQILDTGPGNEPHNGCDSGGGGIDGWHTLEVITLPKKASSLYFCVNGSGCSPGPSNCVSIAGAQTAVLTCGDSGTQSPSYNYNYDIQYKEDFIVESIDDKCVTLAADADCKLRKETIDGVIIYSNFNPTGKTSSNTCQTFTGVESHDICREWWTDTKEYLCYGQKTDFDFSEVKERGKTVLRSSVQAGSTLLYDDYRKDGSGGYSTSKEAMKLYDSASYDNCVKVCKIRAPKTDTQAGMSGTTADYRTGISGYDVFYKKCSNGLCPLDTVAGEELLADCACPDDFAEAASIMSALEEASKDILCSSSGGW